MQVCLQMQKVGSFASRTGAQVGVLGTEAVAVDVLRSQTQRDRSLKMDDGPQLTK